MPAVVVSPCTKTKSGFSISKTKFLDNPKHLVLTSVHPSPLSAYGGFFGSKPFSKTNNFLRQNNIREINWLKK